MTSHFLTGGQFAGISSGVALIRSCTDGKKGDATRVRDLGFVSSTLCSADPVQGVNVHEQVAEVIEIIRPAIQADGGDINLLDIDVETGIVTVELTGACVSCPASTVTMKAGIERIMKDRVPGVTEVRQPGEDLVETGTTVSL